MEFSKILQQFLCEEGMTQTMFARAVGIKQSQVSEWLKGKAKPGYDMLKQICLALNLSANFLLGLEERRY